MQEQNPFSFDLQLFSIVFRLHPIETMITSDLTFKKTNAHQQTALGLNALELNLKGLSLNGHILHENVDYEKIENGAGYIILLKTEVLTAAGDESETFTVSIETSVNPSQNKEMRGLYMVDEIYATQVRVWAFGAAIYAANILFDQEAA